MFGLAERQSVTKTRLTPAPCNAATRLWLGAKSVIEEGCSANGAQIRTDSPSTDVEKSRNRTVNSSRAIWFSVTHCGSRAPVWGCGAMARLRNSLAAADANSLADSAMKAGHRKAADASWELFSPYMDHSLTLDQENAKCPSREEIYRLDASRLARVVPVNRIIS